MATVVFHSSAECPELVMLPRLWHAAQAVCTTSLPSPSGSWTAPRPCIGSWLLAGSARNRIAAPRHVKFDFAGIVPPSKKDLSYVRQPRPCAPFRKDSNPSEDAQASHRKYACQVCHNQPTGTDIYDGLLGRPRSGWNLYETGRK